MNRYKKVRIINKNLAQLPVYFDPMESYEWVEEWRVRHQLLPDDLREEHVLVEFLFELHVFNEAAHVHMDVLSDDCKIVEIILRRAELSPRCFYFLNEMHE